MKARESGLEVSVWLRCESTNDLARFAEVLDDPVDGSERIPPPAGRRNLVQTWTHLQEDPGAEPWHDAMLYGVGQAAFSVDRAAEHGIDVEVYAIRVAPVDAEFEPEIPATRMAA